MARPTEPHPGVVAATSALGALLQELCQLCDLSVVDDYRARTNHGKRRMTFKIDDFTVMLESTDTAFMLQMEEVIGEVSGRRVMAELESACSPVPGVNPLKTKG